MTQFYKPMIGPNVYLEPKFRKELIEKVYANIPELSDDIRRDLLTMTKELVKIAGFSKPPCLLHYHYVLGLLKKKFERFPIYKTNTDILGGFCIECKLLQWKI